MENHVSPGGNIMLFLPTFVLLICVIRPLDICPNIYLRNSRHSPQWGTYTTAVLTVSILKYLSSPARNHWHPESVTLMFC